MQQDPSLNNLVHPEDYQTAPLGTLGHVEKRGYGPIDLILIPGLGFAWDTFASFMEANQARYTMYAVTLAGHGQTAAPPMPSSETSYSDLTWIRGGVAAIATLIEKEDMNQPIVVGHLSLGGHVALQVAKEHPALIGGIVALSGEVTRPLSPSGFDGLTPEARANAVDIMLGANWFKTVTKETWDANMWPADIYAQNPERAQALWDQVAEVPLPVMVRYLCEFLAMDRAPELAVLDVPMLVVMPGFTTAYLEGTPHPNAVRYFQGTWGPVQKTNPTIQFTTLEDAHLFMMEDQPEALDAILASFITQR